MEVRPYEIKSKICRIFIIVLFISNNWLYDAQAAADSFNINLTVDSGAVVCDNDGVCDTGENQSNCPNDCGCNNNGVCQPARGETTANCPADCPSAGGGGELPDTTPPTIYNIEVSNITFTSAQISWRTTEQARCALYLGQTIDYEKLTLTGLDLLREHSSSLTDLTQSALYNFKISCQDQRGNQGQTPNQWFSTLSPPDETPPPNVDDFTAQGKDKQVDLDWQNPVVDDFENILIVRSTDFYPQKPWHGEPIYTGRQPIVEDRDVENDITYYYTAFSYDQKGNYSSGAVAKAVPRKPGVPLPPVEPVEPPVEPPPPEVEKLEIGDFRFFQKGREVFPDEASQFSFEPESPITALIEYEKVPEVLKTLLVSLEKENKFFSFLLRIDEEKKEYSAVLQPPPPGQYPMSLYVLDYKNQALKKMTAFLNVKDFLLPPEPIVKPLSFFKEKILFWLILLFLIIGAIAYWRLRCQIERRKQKQKLNQ